MEKPLNIEVMNLLKNTLDEEERKFMKYFNAVLGEGYCSEEATELREEIEEEYMDDLSDEERHKKYKEHFDFYLKVYE